MGQSEREFLIITGLSGAGKTQASKVLEDIGFFCVDNLPAPLISRFAELILQSEGSITRVCLVVDLRGESFLDGIDEALAYLRALGISYRILFLEASEEVLVRRFKETRRSHPQSQDGSLLTGIDRERAKLAALRKMADDIIDTSAYSNKDLRDALLSRWNDRENAISVSVMSFGFKHGVPIDADIIMDVRFLKNPFYVPELRSLTGRDEAVRDYIFANPEARSFLQKLQEMIFYLLPLYQNEGKSHLSIGIGCTGGQHRSIALAIALGDALEQAGYRTMVNHRDH